MTVYHFATSVQGLAFLTIPILMHDPYTKHLAPKQSIIDQRSITTFHNLYTVIQHHQPTSQAPSQHQSAFFSCLALNTPIPWLFDTSHFTRFTLSSFTRCTLSAISPRCTYSQLLHPMPSQLLYPMSSLNYFAPIRTRSTIK